MRGMAIRALIPALLLIAQASKADNLLNNPESVVFDPAGQRYLVSNYGDGSIVELDLNGGQRYFNTDLTRTVGLHLRGGVVYAASNDPPYVGIVGFDLETAGIVCFVPIETQGLLNDITSDSQGNLYVTDYYDSKIFKVRPQNGTYTLFRDQGLNWPNGIFYEEAGNRLLAVQNQEAGYPLKAISVADSSISTVLYTNLPSVDGIVQDSRGYTYLSSWYTNSIHRYQPGPANPLQMFSSGHDAPADIYYNPYHDVLAVPNFYWNTIDIVPVNPAGVAESGWAEVMDLKAGPNPFTDHCTIRFRLEESRPVRLDLFDPSGRWLGSPVEAVCPAGTHEIDWMAPQGPAGVYLWRLQAGGDAQAGSLVRLK